jgi:hypothetical protein
MAVLTGSVVAVVLFYSVGYYIAVSCRRTKWPVTEQRTWRVAVHSMMDDKFETNFVENSTLR